MAFTRPLTVLVALSAALTAAQPAAAQPAPGQPAPAAAQAAEERPTPEQLFERHVEAIGGRDAVFAVTSRQIEGVYEGPPFPGRARLSSWAVAPGKFHMRVAQPLGLTIETFSDGDLTWERVDEGDPRPIAGPRRIEMLEAADFYGEAGYQERYQTLEVVGRGDFRGHDSWAVKAISRHGRERRLYFDAESGLFIGERSAIARLNDDQKLAPILVEVELQDYQDFGGVLYPTRQIQEIPSSGTRVVLEYRSVTINAVTEHEFSPPAGAADQIRSVIEQADAAAAEAAANAPARTGG